jgi:hypothetical protein
MDHAVAIAAEGAAGAAFTFRKQPAAALLGIAGKRRPRRGHADSHDLPLKYEAGV